MTAQQAGQLTAVGTETMNMRQAMAVMKEQARRLILHITYSNWKTLLDGWQGVFCTPVGIVLVRSYLLTTVPASADPSRP